MPLYEYHCTECDHGFELRRKASERTTDAPCPSCGSEATEPRISAPSRLNVHPSSGGHCSPGGCCGGACHG